LARERRALVMRRCLAILGLCAALLGAGCSSFDLHRTGPEGGTFRSRAWTFTILSKDLPGPALSFARNRAADSGRPDLVVEHETVIPYLGPVDWLLDIIGVRYARVSGTWGRP
jgi:hypothetical protein